jgi:CheY-like chemotaxis protein
VTAAVRVVVVEDSPVQRAHLVDILQAEDDIAVVGQAGDPHEAVALVHRLRPDVVTMDLGLPGGGGIGAIERIMADLPTPILVLSARVSCAGSAAAVESLLAGAVDSLPKPERWDTEAERQVRCRVRLLSGVTVVAHPRGRRRPPAPDPHRAPPVAIAASTGGAGRDPALPDRAGRAGAGRAAPPPAAGRRLRRLDAAGVGPARGGGRRRRPAAAGGGLHRARRRPPQARSRSWRADRAGSAPADHPDRRPAPGPRPGPGGARTSPRRTSCSPRSPPSGDAPGRWGGEESWSCCRAPASPRR